MQNQKKTVLLLILSLALTVQAQSIIDHDLDRDGYIGLNDLQIIASQWLDQNCDLTAPCQGADVYPECGDGKVNLKDFASFGEVYGECYDPTNPGCVHIPLSLYEPPASSVPAEGVQLFSGEFTKTAVDMHIPGRGIDFSWARTYRSRTGANTPIGNNWDFSYNIYLERCRDRLILHNGSGRRDTYYPQGGGIWAADGLFCELELQLDNSLTLTFPDTSIWTFLPFADPDAPGKVSVISDRNGNSLDFDYDSSGRLFTVHDTLGTPINSRDIIITYNATDNISAVTDWMGRQVTFDYYEDGDAGGSAGDLKSVTSPSVTNTPTGNNFPSGKTTTYTYSKGFADEELNHNLLTVTDPHGQIYLTNTYGTTYGQTDYDFVTRQSLGGLNDIIDFTYLLQVPNLSNNYAITRVIVNDRMGNVSERFYDHHNRNIIHRDLKGRADPNHPTSINPDSNLPKNPLRATDPAFFETRYEYNSDSLVTRIIYPNDNEEVFVYDSLNSDVRSRGNLLHQTSLPDPSSGDKSHIVESFEYDPTVNNNTNFLTRHVDPRGNETLHEYDSHGNVTSTTCVRISDPNIVENWTYDAFGRLTSHTLPDNGSGVRRLDIYDYYGQVDGPQNGYLKESTKSSGIFDLTTTYEYDAVGNITRLIDPNGYDTQFIFNELNQVVRTISPEVIDGRGVRYETDTIYDKNNNVVEVRVANINGDGSLDPVMPVITTTNQYDILDNVIQTVRDIDTSNTIVTEYEYDDNRNMALVRSGEATNSNQPDNVVRTLYDERDLVFQVTRGYGDPNQSTTQYDYDGNGNRVTISEGLEGTPNVTTQIFDGYDRLVQTTDPMGNVAELQYDDNGNVTNAMNKGELVDAVASSANVRLSEVINQYDELNRLIVSETLFFDPNTQVDIGDGKVTTSTIYSDTSQPLQITDDLSRQTHFHYDPMNRLEVETDPKGNSKTYSYDKNSNIISTTRTDKSDLRNPDETFTTTFDYDNLNRTISMTDNDNNTTQSEYDSRGNLTSTTDALGSETAYTYDGLDRLTQTVRDMDNDGADGDGDDIVTTQGWDDASRLISRTDDNGNTTAFEYDSLDRVTRTTYADGTSSTSEYDVHDNLVGHLDANGSRATFTHDSADRTKGGLYIPDTGVSSDTTFQSFEYDGLGRIVSAQDDDSTVTRVYDSLSNLTQETTNGTTVSSTYDSLGNYLTSDYPGGRQVSYTYDALDRKKTISDAAGGIADYDYIGGRVEKLTYGNLCQCERGYDALGRTTSTEHTFGMVTIDSRSYAWDPLSNKTQRIDLRSGGLAHTYEYDPVYRLTRTSVENDLFPPVTVRDTQYDLDGVGNRTNVSGVGTSDVGAYTLDPILPSPGDFQMNQYTQIPWLNSIIYSANGNLTTTTASAVSGPVNNKYDVFDRLVEVDDTSLAGDTITFAYDAMGRRIKKTVADSLGTATTTNYYYDGARVIEEQDDIGTTLATYVYGLYIDEVLNMQQGAADYYYHTDDMCNVMALTDNTGAVIERIEYDDYGNPTITDPVGTPLAGSSVSNPYMFNGRRYDSETGLYYYRTRYMDPRAGRFTSRDTIGIWGDGANLGNGNAYAGNNPWSSLDPFGQHKVKFKAGADLSKKVNIAGGGGGDSFGGISQVLIEFNTGMSGNGGCITCECRSRPSSRGSGWSISCRSARAGRKSSDGHPVGFNLSDGYMIAFIPSSGNTGGGGGFGEFEREIEILASVAGGHIGSGGSSSTVYRSGLKPPRVGIVMEYSMPTDLRDGTVTGRRQHGFYSMTSGLRDGIVTGRRQHGFYSMTSELRDGTVTGRRQHGYFSKSPTGSPDGTVTGRRQHGVMAGGGDIWIFGGYGSRGCGYYHENNCRHKHRGHVTVLK